MYFSSDSHNGFGGLDVFFVDLAKNGEVTNAGKPVNSEKDDFAFSYNIDKKVGFFSSNRTGQDDILLANLLCNTVFKIAVIDAETGKPIPESEIVVLENNKPLESLTANDRGETGTKLPCDKEYVIQVAKVGYEKTVQPILKTSLPQLPLVVKLTPTKVIVTEKEIVLQEIRFEYDKSNITQAGAKELDKLVAIMKSNPTMVILIKAHTDNRGTVKYNLDLSDRRAKATAQYIISKGIEKERISGVGVGENEPKVACDKCTEEQHAINRCSEFIIVKK